MLKEIIILLGIYMLVMTMLSLARRKMTEQFCLLWGVLSVIMILFGILINPTEILRYISGWGLICLLVGILLVIHTAWFISTQVSILIRKNQELAMQVSLLNQENEQIIKNIHELKEQLHEKEEQI